MAFAFGVIGMVAWVLIGGFGNIISAWIAIVMALGIRFGYDKAKGPKKGRIFIIIALYVIQVFVSIYLMYYIILSSIIEIGFFDVFPIMANPLLQSSEKTLEYILLGVFSGLGLLFLLISGRFIKKQEKFNESKTKANAGERFTKVVPFTGDYEKMDARIKELLTKSGYTLQAYGDEQLYRSGDGIWVASKYLKYSKVDEGILMEAFVIIGQKEAGLDGSVGVVAKKPLKNLVKQLTDLIKINN